DAKTAPTGNALLSGQWVAILPSGQPQSQTPPEFLTQRPDTDLALARGGKAYAMLPFGAQLAACTQQVEVLTPSGSSCRQLDFPIDANACISRDLRMGLDGTVMQMLPSEREPNDPPGSTNFGCTLRYFPAALH